ncbi:MULTISPECIES: hypothetical protein [unclassified Pseudomonas]|uniref:hypothetical protein n=1 Tax=unclassified Pseudomonas TaxID=196821 RepID=UPI001032D903|nr:MULTISPECIES: hypothetical protein [unclassified Pseudomonas]
MDYQQEWSALYKKHMDILHRASHSMDINFEFSAALLALGPYKLKCFAQRLGNNLLAPWEPLKPLEALQLYLINKHHWTLNYARTFRHEKDYLLLLREEIAHLKLDRVEAYPVRLQVKNHEQRGAFTLHFDERDPKQKIA